MITRRVPCVIVALIALVASLASCKKEAEAPVPEPVKISGAGATFPAPLYKTWIEHYRKTHKGVSIAYDPVGSGDGIKRFMSLEVDFGASDAAMSDEQMAKVGRGVKLIPAAAGIVALAYNLKGLNGTLRLPRDVYVDIFSGTIKSWNDPRIKQANPELNLPATAIIPVTRQDGSGTTFMLTNHFSTISAQWREKGPGVGKVVQWPSNAMSARGNEGVAGRIKMTEGSIGYVEYGYAQRAGLAMASLENKAGDFVAPTPARGRATLTNAQGRMPANLRMFFPDPDGQDSYPMVTYSWILLYAEYPDARKAAVLKEFVKWGLTEGQGFGETLGYCRIPEVVVGKAVAAVEGVK
jgi:phosphate transport system substrate-binding protein